MRQKQSVPATAGDLFGRAELVQKRMFQPKDFAGRAGDPATVVVSKIPRGPGGRACEGGSGRLAKSGCAGRPAGGRRARRNRGRHPPQPHAVRVPDSRTEGAAPVAVAGEGASEARRTDAPAYTVRGDRLGRERSAWRYLLIRAAGAEAGWAFQLQDPRTVMLLLLLAVA